MTLYHSSRPDRASHQVLPLQTKLLTGIITDDEKPVANLLGSRALCCSIGIMDVLIAAPNNDAHHVAMLFLLLALVQ